MSEKPAPIQPPSGTPEYMYPAWASCLRWSLTQPDILAWFRQDTGCNWMPPAIPLEHMINRVTGADIDFIERYVQWFNQTVWGPIGGD